MTTPTQEEIEAVREAIERVIYGRTILGDKITGDTLQTAKECTEVTFKAIAALGWRRVPKGCVIIDESRLAILEFSNMRIGAADTTKPAPISEDGPGEG